MALVGVVEGGIVDAEEPQGQAATREPARKGARACLATHGGHPLI